MNDFECPRCGHCCQAESFEYWNAVEGWVEPLYTAPPKREWVGLTDEEIAYQGKKEDHAVYFALGALWAQAKLKERNHG